jgi:Fe/S biogenesis protein NfuA
VSVSATVGLRRDPTGSLPSGVMSVDTTPPTTDTSEPAEVFAITPAALERVLGVRANEDDPATLALRIEVTGHSGPDYTYDLSFEPLADAAADDHRQTFGDDGDELVLLLPAASVDRLRGATLDVPSSAGQSGLVIRNPNRPNPLLGVGELTLEGDVAEQVQQLLTEAINPSLAAHGGFASLVGVEGDRVFLTMGGGCQGCSLSQATMVQGIATAIREAIPEVTDVVDVTDHTAGENPFYS